MSSSSRSRYTWSSIHVVGIHGAVVHGVSIHGAVVHGVGRHGAVGHGVGLHGAVVHGVGIHGAVVHGVGRHEFTFMSRKHPWLDNSLISGPPLSPLLPVSPVLKHHNKFQFLKVHKTPVGKVASPGLGKLKYSSGKASISDETPETGSEEPTCGEASELEEASSSEINLGVELGAKCVQSATKKFPLTQ